MINPERAGPVVKASACVVAAKVTARAKCARGTSVGRSAARAGLSKAQEMPATSTIA
jgi:hypothetical protein